MRNACLRPSEFIGDLVDEHLSGAAAVHLVDRNISATLAEYGEEHTRRRL